jgi:hypothetical protein
MPPQANARGGAPATAARGDAIPAELHDLLAQYDAAANGKQPAAREAIRACLDRAGLLNADGDLDVERDPARPGIAPDPTLLTARAALAGEPAILAAPGRELLASLYHDGRVGGIPALLDDPDELGRLARAYAHDRRGYDAGHLRLKGLFPGDELASLRRAVTARARGLRPARPSRRSAPADAKPARTFLNDDGEPDDPREYACRKLGLPIRRTVRRPADSGHLYDLELDDGRQLPLGDSVLDPRRVEKVLEGHDIVIRYYTPAQWRTIAAALIAIVKNEAGVTAEDVLKGWIRGRLEGAAPTLDLKDDDDRSAAISNDGFWTAGDVLYVYLDRLEEYVRGYLKMPVTRAQLVARLGRLGFTRERVRETRRSRDQEPGKRMFWRSPPGFRLDELDDERAEP